MNNSIQLKDSFGRVHDYLRISLTDRCNLRCTYCMPADGIELRDKAEFMTAEETLSIAKTFVGLGVKKIRLTGGEPLIKKNFELILRGLSQLPIEIVLTTNAVIVDKYLELLWECGVRKINVSLDSLKEERVDSITRRSYFQRIIDNIYLLITKGFEVKVNAVLIKGTNDDEIIDFIYWSQEKDIQVRFIEFMPFDGNDWKWDKKVSEKTILDEIRNEFGTVNVIKLEDGDHATARSYRIRNSKGNFGVISTMTNPFCGTCNRIRLTADGKIKNCLLSGTESDLLGPLRNGEDIKGLIRRSIQKKEKERAGTSDFSELDEENIKNRSMVAIGG